MGTSSTYIVVLALLCLMKNIDARTTLWEEEENSVDENSEKHVDFFVLAMEWPEGTCEYVNSTGKHECVISKNVTGWVLHGLWPSDYSKRFLQYCSSKKFDFQKVASMKADLLRYWPNLFKDSSKYFLWKHEYEKHGTCAALVPGFETEKEYFSIAMKLLHDFDPLPVLEKKEIVPREKPYDVGDVNDALESKFGGGICTQCSEIQGRNTQVLSGLEICFSKDLNIIKCPHCSHSCRDGDVNFHPINFKSL